jgi:MFS family permease
MLGALLPVRSLLLATFMLMGGGGFLGTMISIRLEQAQVTALLIGLVATSYFAGLTLGSVRAERIIARVGHIRAFVVFVSVYSATSLIYAFHRDPALWTALRFVDGFCMAGVYVCVESWLNERSDLRTRGAVLAGYMIALYSGQGLGQFLINLGEAESAMPFMAGSVLLSLSIIPVALTRILQPTISERIPLSMRRLYAVSPLGVVGATVNGIMLGAFYALGAVHVRRLGMDVSDAALFMSAVIMGGVVLQWPLGLLSDLFDRRRVIVGCFAAAFFLAAALATFGESVFALMTLGVAFGGVAFALYPLSVAHTNDHLSSEERVGASGGLVLAYSVGAALGPLAGAAAMDATGDIGLFGFIALSAAGAALFAAWREWRGVPVPSGRQQPFQTLPGTTPMSATLDPHATEHE